MHTARFAPDKMHVLSGSDDATVSTNIPFTVHATHCVMQVCLASAFVIACGHWRCCKAAHACQQPFLVASSTLSSGLAVYCDTDGREGVDPGADAWTAHVQVRWWDITAGEQLFRLDGHTDYIRSSACSPSSADTWATGKGCPFANPHVMYLLKAIASNAPALLAASRLTVCGCTLQGRMTTRARSGM